MKSYTCDSLGVVMRAVWFSFQCGHVLVDGAQLRGSADTCCAHSLSRALLWARRPHADAKSSVLLGPSAAGPPSGSAGRKSLDRLPPVG